MLKTKVDYICFYFSHKYYYKPVFCRFVFMLNAAHISMDTNLYIYLYHTHSNTLWYTCNKTGKTQNTIRIFK